MIGAQNLSDRWEVQYSYSDHHQDSFYGDMTFQAKERIAFIQGIWRKKIGKHQWLGGLSTRYSWYDDNTTATKILTANNPNFYILPGIFLEDEIILKERHKLLLGMRLDQHRDHGVIATPRAGYKINFDEQTLLRLNAGTGFRVVNIYRRPCCTHRCERFSNRRRFST